MTKRKPKVACEYCGAPAEFCADKPDKFTLAYIECALWSTTDECGDPLDQNYEMKDIEIETIRQMLYDCQQFQHLFGDQIDAALAVHSMYTNREMAGHDFWLTRNSHGIGFWETGLWPPELGEKLSKAAGDAGSFDLYVSDGMICH